MYAHLDPTAATRSGSKILDLIIALDPEVIVPGHGPVCGLEGAMEMKAYLDYVREESSRFFQRGMSSLEAAKRIDLGPYSAWNAPARVYLNIEWAYLISSPRSGRQALGCGGDIRCCLQSGQATGYRDRILNVTPTEKGVHP